MAAFHTRHIFPDVPRSTFMINVWNTTNPLMQLGMTFFGLNLLPGIYYSHTAPVCPATYHYPMPCKQSRLTKWEKAKNLVFHEQTISSSTAQAFFPWGGSTGLPKKGSSAQSVIVVTLPVLRKQVG